MILIVFVVVMSVKIVQLYQKDQTYIEQQAERQSELDAELERQEELKDYESYTGTQEYIEQQANKQGIVYDNQIIFKETDD
jgi:cell division protein DivIC